MKIFIRRFLKYFLICLIFFGLVYVLADEPLDISEFLDKKDFPDQVIEVEPAIYEFVDFYDENLEQPRITATGFFISPHLFVTSFHVVDDLKHFENARLIQKNQPFIEIKRPVALSISLDLTILETKTPSPTFVDYSSISEEKFDEELFMIGYRRGEKRYYKKTNIEAVFKDRFLMMLVNQSESHSGMSGSPILSSQGEALGVVYQDNRGNKTTFTNAKYITSLLDGEIGTQCENHLLKCIEKDKSDIKRKLEEDPLFKSDEVRSLLYHSIRFVINDFFNNNFYDFAERILRLAEEGDMHAQYKMGFIYSYLAQEKNSQQHKERRNLWSFYWYHKAALQGQLSAQTQLGFIYSEGVGMFIKQDYKFIEQDYKKALYWYEKAASRGDAAAIYMLGKLHHEGKGVERDYKKARKFYEESARLGHADSFMALSSMYMSNEIEGETNTKKALELKSMAIILEEASQK